jgi:hypothetical protein
MEARAEHKKLFLEVEQWSQKKDSYSIDDFLKEKCIAISDFELIANSSKKFMKIWGVAESQAWENLKDALFKKSLPRSRIAEYIRECDVFQDQDPEGVMQSLEETQAKLELYLTAVGDTESLRKYGRLPKMNETEALPKCLLQMGLMTEEHYASYLQAEKDCEEYDDED